MSDFGDQNVIFSALGRIFALFRTSDRLRNVPVRKNEETLRHVATFARDPGPFMSCHVATFAMTLATYDIDICLGPRDILAHAKLRLTWTLLGDLSGPG